MSDATSIVESGQNHDNSRLYWQYGGSANPEFDARIFSNNWLAEQGYITNTPSAGRGAALFLGIDGVSLVLRHYRRGGLVRLLSEKSYLWIGLDRTRAWREYAVLCELEKIGLPAPKPYACQVEQRGARYTASLITYFLAGNTLADHMFTAELPKESWYAIGQCIKSFHVNGVDHADLNAHNILVNNGVVSLIDFDRAVIDTTRRSSRLEKNLHRLKRSIGKIAGSGPTFYNEACWAALEHGYVQE